MPETSIGRLAAGVALVASGLVGACSDGPSGPRLGAAAAVEATAGSGQTALVGTAVAVAPAVLVRGRDDAPLEGVRVRFEVAGGGGSVAQTLAVTGPDGVASAGRWTLGSTAGVNELRAQVGTLAPVVFTATAYTPSGSPSTATGAYDIDVRYIGTASTRQRQAVASAVARWRSAITADLPGIPLRSDAGACFEGQPAIAETVDDLLLYVDFQEIDGAGSILGVAGPCYVRSDSNLPIVGHLQLDAADLRQMESRGTLDDVVLHEMGHILGIGTLWQAAGVVSGTGTQDPYFTGRAGVDAYRTLGGGGAGIPVENSGGEGTRDGHWRETVFGNELMTGYIGSTPNPLSAMTIASLQDLGYGATLAAANGYTLGATTSSSRSAIDLRGAERLRRPSHRVDRDGRVHPWDNGNGNGPIRKQ